jgi:hypothetical protein
VAILVFFIFVVLVVFGILALGCGLSLVEDLVEDRTVGRRCRIPHEMRRKRKVQRQKARCRFEG